MPSTGTSKALEVLGSADESVPNLLLQPHPNFAQKAEEFGVWQGDVVAWYAQTDTSGESRNKTDPHTEGYAVISPPDLMEVSDKEQHMHAPTHTKRQDVTFASFLGRLIPLVIFVCITILVVTLKNLQQSFALSLLLIQIAALVIAIRVWIPRERKTRR